MSTDFFDQDDGEFRDMPDEVQGNHAEPVNVTLQRKAAPTYAQPAGPQQEPESELVEIEAEVEDEDDYSSVLSDARLRLEQGRLYELIMNHDLFGGLDADPAAVKHVQRQIRKFAKEQMEIMLGMRRESTKIETLEIDFPFTNVEVDVLKMLASTASKGKASQSDRYVPEVKRVTQEVNNVPRKEGLNTIGSKPKKENKVEKKLPERAVKPVQRKPLTKAEEQILAEEQVSKADIDSTFEPGYKPLDKPLHEMTEDEIIERNRQSSNRRHKLVKSPNALPMPTPDQERMLHETRLIESSGSKSSLNNAILALLNQRK